jgi:molybdopterin synthase sulfur carrier subunit
MQLLLLTFAQAREQLGFGERAIECAATDTPREVLRRIAPEFSTESCRVAVDQEYADWDQPIGQAQELALIPPVSGG